MKRYISEKDLLVLNYLLNVRVATVYQIMRDVFPAYSRIAVVKRLNCLADKKYIKKDSFAFKMVYSLGYAGIKYFREQDVILDQYKPAFLGFNPNSIKHDLLLTDIYSHFKGIKNIFDIQTHNQQMIMKRDQHALHNISDLLLWIKKDNQKYQLAFELELTRKNPQSYTPIFDLYRNDENIGLVLYLVSQYPLKRELLSIEQQIFKDSKSKIFIGFIDDFLRNPSKAVFTSWNKKTFSFQSLRTNNEEKALSDLTSNELQSGYNQVTDCNQSKFTQNRIPQ